MNDEDTKILENVLHKAYTNSILHPNTYIRENEVKAIENLINRKKELEEETIELLNSKIGIDLSYDDYIPVSKIKENIELMQESIVNEDYSENTNLVNCSVFDTNIVISYLLELLEGK